MIYQLQCYDIFYQHNNFLKLKNNNILNNNIEFLQFT